MKKRKQSTNKDLEATSVPSVETFRIVFRRGEVRLDATVPSAIRSTDSQAWRLIMRAYHGPVFWWDGLVAFDEWRSVENERGTPYSEQFEAIRSKAYVSFFELLGVPRGRGSLKYSRTYMPAGEVWAAWFPDGPRPRSNIDDLQRGLDTAYRRFHEGKTEEGWTCLRVALDECPDPRTWEPTQVATTILAAQTHPLGLSDYARTLDLLKHYLLETQGRISEALILLTWLMASAEPPLGLQEGSGILQKWAATLSHLQLAQRALSSVPIVVAGTGDDGVRQFRELVDEYRTSTVSPDESADPVQQLIGREADGLLEQIIGSSLVSAACEQVIADYEQLPHLRVHAQDVQDARGLAIADLLHDHKWPRIPAKATFGDFCIRLRKCADGRYAADALVPQEHEDQHSLHVEASELRNVVSRLVLDAKSEAKILQYVENLCGLRGGGRRRPDRSTTHSSTQSLQIACEHLANKSARAFAIQLHGDLQSFQPLLLRPSKVNADGKEPLDLHLDATVGEVALIPPRGNSLIIAPSGAGKTTFLLDLHCRLLEMKGWLAFFVEAKTLARLHPINWSTVKQLLIQQLTPPLSEKDARGLVDVAREGQRLVLMVDQLDNAGGAGRSCNDILYALRELSDAVVWIASARPTAISVPHKGLDCHIVQLQPFGPGAQQAFFGNDYDAAVGLCGGLQHMLATPMVAHALRTIVRTGECHRIASRAALHSRCIHFALYEHSANRQETNHNTWATTVQKAMGIIAFGAIDRPEPEWQSISIGTWSPLLEEAGIPADILPASGLVDFVSLDTSSDPRPCIRFAHQSFQEYLAAWWINEDTTGLRLKRILQQIWDPKWKEVLRYLAGVRGEDLIRRVYPEGGKDTVICSRLLLAAELAPEASCEHTVTDRLMRDLAVAAETPSLTDRATALAFGLSGTQAFDRIWQQFLVHGRKGDWPRATRSLSLIASIEFAFPADAGQTLVDMVLSPPPDCRVPALHAMLCLERTPGLGKQQMEMIRVGLQSQVPNVRARAVYLAAGLSSSLPAEDVTAVIHALLDPAVPLHTGVITSQLKHRFSDADIARSVSELHGASPETRTRIMGFLAGLGSRLTVPQLLELLPYLTHSDPDTRAVAEGIVTERSADVARELGERVSEWIHDDRGYVRVTAIRVARYIDEEREVHWRLAVYGALNDSDAMVRRSALRAAQRIRSLLDADDVNLIVGVLDDTDVGTRCEAVATLLGLAGQLTQTQMNSLAMCLESSDDDMIATLNSVPTADALEWPEPFIQSLRNARDRVGLMCRNGRPRGLFLALACCAGHLSQPERQQLARAVTKVRGVYAVESALTSLPMMTSMTERQLKTVLRGLTSLSPDKKALAFEVACRVPTRLEARHIRALARHVTTRYWGHVSNSILQRCAEQGMLIPTKKTGIIGLIARLCGGA